MKINVDDFEAHPVGTARRLAELEGLAFARRRTEYACPVTDEDADAARRAYYADNCSPWDDAPTSARDVWRRVAEAVRDRLSGREMVAVAHPDTRPNTEGLPGALLGQPIDLADLRPGDVFEARQQQHVDAEGYRVCTGAITYYLLDRPDPDAALIEAMAERAARADDALCDGEWPAGFPDADAYRTIIRTALAALRETHTIKPKATTGDLRA